MTFKRIGQEHPYLDAGICDEGPNYGLKDNFDRLYHPTDADWPLVRIHLVRTGAGLTIFSSIKEGPDSWWYETSTFNPLPWDLVPVLADMILICIKP